jgi:hypothetical protein
MKPVKGKKPYNYQRLSLIATNIFSFGAWIEFANLSIAKQNTYRQLYILMGSDPYKQ